MNVKRNKKLLTIIVFVLILIVAASSYLIKKFRPETPSEQTVSLKEIYGVEEGEVALITNGYLSGIRGLWENDHGYLSLKVIREELNNGFYWNTDTRTLEYALPSEVKLYSASDRFDNAPAFLIRQASGSDTAEADSVYVSLDLLAEYTNIRVETFRDEVNRIFIRSSFGESTYALSGKNVALRDAASTSAPIICRLNTATRLWVIRSEADWSKVYSSDYGCVGYVQSDSLTGITTEKESGPYSAPVAITRKAEEPVCLVWHQVFKNSGVNSLEDLLHNTDGVNVISPTWFSIDASDGTLLTRVSKDYVSIAHDQGLKLWALVENINTTNSLNYSELLGSYQTRKKMIDELVSTSLRSGIDGINVDLEGLPSSCGDDYLQFVRELAVACHQNDLTVSVDTYVPSSWTNHYHRKEISEFVDYLIIMAYDEHYAGSEAGSTASLDFVRSGIEDTLAEGVSESMVITALPFYSRLWSGENNTLTSVTIDMDDMKALTKRSDVDLSWDSDSEQYYVEYTENDTLFRCWIEDEESLGLKLTCMGEHDLAGVAGWKLGMENASAWTAIRNYLKN